MSRTFLLFTAPALCAALLFAGCSSKKASTKPDAQTAAAAIAEESRSPGIKPVYPPTPDQVPAGVTALCEALHTLPNQRKAACCEGTSGIVVTDECVRNLSGAVTQKGLSIDPEKLKLCTAALAKTYEGCDWVGPHMPAVPQVCVQALAGLRKEGDVCHSSLECQGILRCAGAGPTDPGKCRPAAPVGKLCGTATDALGAYLRIDADALRPGCADGFCDRNICRATIGAGGDCRASVQCGAGLRCAGGHCIDGAQGAAKQSCTGGGDCAEGLRCVGQACAAPLPNGAPCNQHTQCQSGCLQGTCQMVCSAAQLLRQLPAANQPAKQVLKPTIQLKIPKKAQ